MLKILHTADWHLGYVTKVLAAEDARKLAKARLSVVEKILRLARGNAVDAVVCAGDLFDSATPGEDWWRGLLSVFARFPDWRIPVVLLPGNHDPYTESSVYWPAHEFRKSLPAWALVVDREDFQLEIGTEAVIVARPCTSSAGDTDLALALPERPPGDMRIRIGVVHGSTFDMPGYRTNFPIARDAGKRRGLDYLAVGDTHAFRDVTPDGVPTIYPSAPEPTNFGEIDAGYVAIALFSRCGSRPSVKRDRVGNWCWRDVAIHSLSQLRALLAEDSLDKVVLRLRFDLEVSLSENEELEACLDALRGTSATVGRAGALVVHRDRLRIEVRDSAFPEDLPDTIKEAIEVLRSRAAHEPRAKDALAELYRLTRDLC